MFKLLFYAYLHIKPYYSVILFLKYKIYPLNSFKVTLSISCLYYDTLAFNEWNEIIYDNILYLKTTFILFSVAKRPPVEETANFLHTLIMNHGPNYLEKLFGSKARNALAPLGGMQKVAIALSGKFAQYL